MNKRPAKKKRAPRRPVAGGRRKAKLSSESIPDLINAMREERIREMAGHSQN